MLSTIYIYVKCHICICRICTKKHIKFFMIYIYVYVKYDIYICVC